jgi:hypothetical protein
MLRLAEAKRVSVSSSKEGRVLLEKIVREREAVDSKRARAPRDRFVKEVWEIDASEECKNTWDEFQRQT